MRAIFLLIRLIDHRIGIELAFALGPLEVRMWRLNACPRLILPVPVFLKRFAAPLCVFSFGIASFYYNTKQWIGTRGHDCTPP